jgi:lipid A 3-O-deacylase
LGKTGELFGKGLLKRLLIAGNRKNPSGFHFRTYRMYRPLRRSFFLAILASYSSSLHPQVIDNTSTFKNIGATHYFRLHYDNDYFSKMDQYYSQGITLEYVAPGLRGSPLARLLLRLPGSEKKYGIAFDLSGYTPDDTHSDGIVYGDRPFTACITLKSFLISTDTQRHVRLASAFIVGAMGPAAFGKQIQVGIHTWLHNIIPRGWENQLHNDVIANYQLSLEKELFSNSNNLIVNGMAEFRAGSRNDALSTGLNLMFGHFNDPYRSARSTGHPKKWQYYFYLQPRLNLVAYDATLQGGLVNHTSPYTIPASNIERATLQADAGLVLSYRRLLLSYAQSYLTKEFSTGEYHRWGGITIGIGF